MGVGVVYPWAVIALSSSAQRPRAAKDSVVAAFGSDDDDVSVFMEDYLVFCSQKNHRGMSLWFRRTVI
jgi:hypothetical protein